MPASCSRPRIQPLSVMHIASSTTPRSRSSARAPLSPTRLASQWPVVWKLGQSFMPLSMTHAGVTSLSSTLCTVRMSCTWAAVQDMRTVHKVLLKLVTPAWVIDKGMKLWPNFHTTGHWEAKRVGDKGARAELRDLGVVDEAMCMTLKGWILGLLQLAGIKHANVDHVACRAR